MHCWIWISIDDLGADWLKAWSVKALNQLLTAKEKGTEKTSQNRLVGGGLTEVRYHKTRQCVRVILRETERERGGRGSERERLTERQRERGREDEDGCKDK